MGTPKVAFVDDDHSVIKALRRGMRLHCRDWDIRYYSSATEALDDCNEFEPWVVVSDKRMPGMDGVAFLSAIKMHYPEAIRIMLTGDLAGNFFCEVMEIAQVLLAKPVEMRSLMMLFDNIIRLRSLPLSSQQRRDLGQVSKIPVMPKVYGQLSVYLSNDDIDLSEVGRFISQDPLLLAKVLQLANSPFLGFVSPVDCAESAVVRLGIDTVKALVLTTEVYQQCHSLSESHLSSLKQQAMDVSQLCWQLGGACGLSRNLSDRLFTMGLLHNLGAVLSAIQESDSSHGKSPIDLDLAGAYMLSLWGFDNVFAESIMYQRTPDLAPKRNELMCLLYVALIANDTWAVSLSVFSEESSLNWGMVEAQSLLEPVRGFLQLYENTLYGES